MFDIVTSLEIVYFCSGGTEEHPSQGASTSPIPMDTGPKDHIPSRYS